MQPPVIQDPAFIRGQAVIHTFLLVKAYLAKRFFKG